MRPALLTCAAIVFCAFSLQGQVVLCDSINNTYRECRVGSAGTVRLVSELSARACFEGLTWGTRSGGIVWVDRGCRATFTSGDGSLQTNGNRLVCESTRGFLHACSANVENGVTLAQQLSEAPCVKGKSWDISVERHEVWVDRGCRAEFALGRFTEAVRPSAPLDAPVTCSSKNSRRTHCPADTSAGVQLVRAHGRTACGYGAQWGYDAKGIWVSKGCSADFVTRGRPRPIAPSITCQSTGDRVRCAAETTYGVALARQLDESVCILGRSWGFDSEGIWVDGNCHAQFALGGYRLPSTAIPATAFKVTCESVDGARVQCPAAASGGVGLVQQLSENTCVLNRTWGYGEAGIWVSGGCRAEFAVAR